MKHLKRLIDERGFTQASLAQKMGRDQSQISHWVTGRRKPSYDNLLDLASALGCCVEALVFDEPTNSQARRACRSLAIAIGGLSARSEEWADDLPDLQRLRDARSYAHRALIDIEALIAEAAPA